MGKGMYSLVLPFVFCPNSQGAKARARATHNCCYNFNNCKLHLPWLLGTIDKGQNQTVHALSHVQQIFLHNLKQTKQLTRYIDFIISFITAVVDNRSSFFNDLNFCARLVHNSLQGKKGHLRRCHDSQQNDTQHNDTLHNIPQHINTQYFGLT